MQSRGLQILLAVGPFLKYQISHRTPNELYFSDPDTSQIRGGWINTNY